MSQEIEKKYIVKKMPDLKDIKPIRYERYYINSNIDNQIRVQRREDRFELETKIKVNDIEYKKEKREITKREFLELTRECKTVIIRDSYLISRRPNITVKIYYGTYRGLIRAEVEFDNQNEYNDFKVPEWFGEEITNSKLGMDAKLVKLDRKRFLEILNFTTINNK